MTKQLIIASETRLAQYAKAVKEGLELSSGARSSSTYYHTKKDQIEAIRKKVESLYNVDKAIPLLLASLDDSTLFFRQEVVRNELAKGALNGPQGIVSPSIWIDNKMQEVIVNHIIESLPITYTLRLFSSFKRSVNNSRTSGKIKKWVLANLNDFTAMKYSNGFKDILKHSLGKYKYSAIMRDLHAHLNGSPHNASKLQNQIFKYFPGSSEDCAKLLLFVDGSGDHELYKNMKHTGAFHKAKRARTKDTFLKYAELLDTSVALGIISKTENSLFDSFKESDGKLKASIKGEILSRAKTMSDDQKVRTKSLQEKTSGKVRTDVDYSKVQTETLYKTEGVEIERKVRAKEDKISLPYTRIGVIQDISLSNRGGKDSKGTPAAVIEHLVNVLRESCSNVVVEQTVTTQTDLTKPFVNIIKVDPTVEAIFVLSDGYENFPYEGCLSDMVEKYRKNNDVQVIHCSPYVSAEMKAQARSLGDNIISMAVNKPSQISTQMEARLLDFNPKVYFQKQFEKYLNKPDQFVEEEIYL